MMRTLFGVLLLLVAWCAYVHCQWLPQNPCPNVFQYKKSDGTIYGEIRLPYDGKGFLELGVNVSFTGLHDTKIKLELATEEDFLLNSGTVIYYVYFPFSNLIPRITQIKFNGYIYCTGPPEKPTGGSAVTNVWASITKKMTVYTVGTNVREPSADVENPFPPINPIVPDRVTQPSAVNQISNFDVQPSSVENNNRFEEKDEECGVVSNGHSLLVGGTQTGNNEFPWLVAIFKAINESYVYHCSGVLITKSHVATAANCIRFFNAVILPTEDMLLVLGKSDLSRWVTNGAIWRTVRKVAVHPEYKQYTGHGDLAILVMKEPVGIQRNVRPICLWTGDVMLESVVGKVGIVAGWGRDEAKRNVPLARKVNMPIVAQETCLRSNGGSFADITSNLTFCAGKRDGEGPCVGDSGSGFMLEVDNKYYLRGLVSVSIQDMASEQPKCDLNQYIVFCDTAKLGDWIETTIEDTS